MPQPSGQAAPNHRAQAAAHQDQPAAPGGAQQGPAPLGEGETVAETEWGDHRAAGEAEEDLGTWVFFFSMLFTSSKVLKTRDEMCVSAAVCQVLERNLELCQASFNRQIVTEQRKSSEARELALSLQCQIRQLSRENVVGCNEERFNTYDYRALCSISGGSAISKLWLFPIDNWKSNSENKTTQTLFSFFSQGETKRIGNI